MMGRTRTIKLPSGPVHSWCFNIIESNHVVSKTECANPVELHLYLAGWPSSAGCSTNTTCFNWIHGVIFNLLYSSKAGGPVQ